MIDLLFINGPRRVNELVNGARVKGTLVYLVCINANTRKLYMRLTNEVSRDDDGVLTVQQVDTKSTDAYLLALSVIVDQIRSDPARQNTKISLMGDGEGAFGSEQAWRYYDQHNIGWSSVRRDMATEFPAFMTYQQSKVKSQPNHTSLGLLDRVVRTIRDMAFNSGIGTITPSVMKQLIDLYNRAPHITLSKIMHFEISPDIVTTWSARS
jgi:hypothetical protein